MRALFLHFFMSETTGLIGKTLDKPLEQTFLMYGVLCMA